MTRASKEPQWKDSEEHQMIAGMEIDTCQQATAVVTITGALKEHLVKRGIPGDKITVVPNGVDTEHFTPRSRDPVLEARLGYQGKKVIGYVGSFVQYEGLDYLLKAAAILRNKGLDDFRVLLVGDGEKYEELQTMSDKLHIRDIVTFTGRVPHTEVESYYSLIDITPFPRKGQPVCEIVSPLKPFEAMSMAKVVVASNVAALAEIIHDNETGILHKKDDVKHLAHVLEILLNNHELRQKLGTSARQWVVANRKWSTVTQKLAELYNELLERNRSNIARSMQ
jgi:glycosyltransferase involved in cell wall biosynthesis